MYWQPFQSPSCVRTEQSVQSKVRQVHTCLLFQYGLSPTAGRYAPTYAWQNTLSGFGRKRKREKFDKIYLGTKIQIAIRLCMHESVSTLLQNITTRSSSAKTDTYILERERRWSWHWILNLICFTIYLPRVVLGVNLMTCHWGALKDKKWMDKKSVWSSIFFCKRQTLLALLVVWKPMVEEEEEGLRWLEWYQSKPNCDCEIWALHWNLSSRSFKRSPLCCVKTQMCYSVMNSLL